MSDHDDDTGTDATFEADRESSVETWREDGEFRRERVTRFEDPEAWETARERIDGGLEWGVGALVEDDGRVLLVRQDDQWLLPGGEVEDGETHAAALVRELHEETGVTVDPGPRLAVVRNVLRHGDEERSFRFTIHRADARDPDPETTDDPGLADEGIEAVAWHETLPADTLDGDLLTELRRTDAG